MLNFICLFFPPVVLIALREKIFKNKIFTQPGKRRLIKEYCLSNLFVNFTAISVTYLVFNHAGPLESSILQYTDFAFKYLLLAMMISLIEPVAEYVIRFHLSVNCKFKKLEIRNYILYFYTLSLFALNFIRIFDNAFWGDEGYTIKLAKMGVERMINTTAGDVHPPLYYLFTQLLYHFGGNHGYTYHLSGLIPYAVILIIACTAVNKYFGKIPAFVLVTMSSIMKNAVVNNVEVRMYSLAAMFVLAAYIALYCIIEKNRVIDWVIFCIMSLGAAYTHYYALISVAFFYMMLIPVVIKNHSCIKRLIISYVATVLAYLPWLRILLQSFKRTSDSWWLGDIPLISDCIKYIFDYKWVFVTFVISIIFFAINQSGTVNFVHTNNKPLLDNIDISINTSEKINFNGEILWILSGLFAIFGTMAVGLGLSYAVRPFFLTRYLFPVSIIAYLILGVCISKMQLRKVWAAVFVMLILWNNIPAYANNYKSESSLNKETSAFLTAVNPSSSDIIYTDNSHLGWTLLPYYYSNNSGGYKPDAIENLDKDYNKILLLWTQKLDETSLENVNKQGYDYEKIYEGRFANGAYYYAYKLDKVDNLE